MAIETGTYFPPKDIVSDIRMYLRDLFAAMVMNSCFERSSTREEAATMAYMEADAMMKAREARDAKR